jgi:hypothetical protein
MKRFLSTLAGLSAKKFKNDEITQNKQPPIGGEKSKISLCDAAVGSTAVPVGLLHAAIKN